MLDGISGSRPPRSSLWPVLLQRVQCYVGLLILLSSDRLLKHGLHFIRFPAPLIGMVAIVASLVIMKRNHPGTALAIRTFFAPAVDWIAYKWLPCFYSPALVTLPLALASLSIDSLGKAVVVTALGVTATAAFASKLAATIRAVTGTELLAGTDHSDHRSDIQFSRTNYAVWSIIALVSSAVLLLSVAAVGPELRLEPQPSTQAGAELTWPVRVCMFGLLLSATVMGYMGGMALPGNIKRIVHPIIACAAAPNAVAVILGPLSGMSYHVVLRAYLTKELNILYWGPGDVLFAFLGVIILCFGFKIVEEWGRLCRHAPEVLGVTSASAAFTLFSTALFARGLALAPDISRALVPRGATLALALPIAEQLGASTQLTAAAVALTGTIGGNFVQVLLTTFGARDPISRGLAAAATAHGLGTAALAAREPEALPFAALSYALCGVAASVLAYIPFIRDALLWITG